MACNDLSGIIPFFSQPHVCHSCAEAKKLSQAHTVQYAGLFVVNIVHHDYLQRNNLFSFMTQLVIMCNRTQ